MKGFKKVEFMKKENEEILNRWRTLGFLQDLKKGSQNEWRCAKSFELMAQYLNKNKETFEINNEELLLLKQLPFPLIRRLICGNRPRVNRIIQPEEIIEPLLNITIDDIINCIETKTNKNVVVSVVKKFVKYYRFEKIPLLKTLAILDAECNLEMIRYVFDIDVEVETVVLFSKYLAIKLAERKSE